jgi:membrane-associated phospholipid phosphatase
MSTSLLNTWAKYISGISSPFVVTAILPLIAISYFARTRSEALLWGTLFIVFVVILPFTYIAYQVYRAKLTDIHIAVREQRTFPFLVALASTTLLLIIYINLDIPYAMLGMLESLILTGLVFLLVTRRTKISIHTAILSGTTLSLAFLVDLRWLYLFLLLPPVIWARIYRGRHTLTQAIGGAVLSCLLLAAFFKLIQLI